MNAQTNEPITFFIDRCLGSKIVHEILRDAGITVAINDEYFGQNAQDVDWLPEIGEKGWVVLTKDAQISKNTTERMAVANANIKMFILAAQNLNGEDMAVIFLKAIVVMQEFVRRHDAPFIAKIYKNGRVEMWKDCQTLLDEFTT